MKNNTENINQESCCSPRSNFLQAFILISVGILFLLNNFGILSWNIWAVLWRLWPLILIMVGLRSLLGSSKGVRVMNILFGLIIFIYAVIVSVSSENHVLDRWIEKRIPWWNTQKQHIERTMPENMFNEYESF